MEKLRSVPAELTPPTLCWDCRRAAGPGMCSWAKRGRPVRGWVATPTIIDGSTPSHCVHTCPLFEPDREGEQDDERTT